MTLKNLHRPTTLLASGALLGLPSLAGAHGLHAESATMLAGALHPFSGLDHLLLLIAAGLWSAQAGASRRRALPLLLLTSLLAGMAAGLGLRNLGVVHPGIGWLENGLAASVVAAGLMLAFAPRLPMSIGASLVSVLALLHGLAHGIESPVGGLAPWAIGVVTGSSLLLYAARQLGLRLQGLLGPEGLRVAGAASALAGVLLLG